MSASVRRSYAFAFDAAGAAGAASGDVHSGVAAARSSLTVRCPGCGQRWTPEQAHSCPPAAAGLRHGVAFDDAEGRTDGHHEGENALDLANRAGVLGEDAD